MRLELLASYVFLDFLPCPLFHGIGLIKLWQLLLKGPLPAPHMRFVERLPLLCVLPAAKRKQCDGAHTPTLSLSHTHTPPTPTPTTTHTHTHPHTHTHTHAHTPTHSHTHTRSSTSSGASTRASSASAVSRERGSASSKQRDSRDSRSSSSFSAAASGTRSVMGRRTIWKLELFLEQPIWIDAKASDLHNTMHV
jgi:hypothetical protein